MNSRIINESEVVRMKLLKLFCSLLDFQAFLQVANKRKTLFDVLLEGPPRTIKVRQEGVSCFGLLVLPRKHLKIGGFEGEAVAASDIATQCRGICGLEDWK